MSLASADHGSVSLSASVLSGLWSWFLACLLVAYGVIEGSRIPADLPECESELVSG